MALEFAFAGEDMVTQTRPPSLGTTLTALPSAPSDATYENPRKPVRQIYKVIRKTPH